jgi:tetratricopeptide (TPR) repeat protein
MNRDVKRPVAAEWWMKHRAEIIIALGLVVLTFAVFGQTLGFGFVNYDDGIYVTDNPHIAAGLKLNNVLWFLTHEDVFVYAPFTMLSLLLDYQVYGFHGGGYHLTNVLLHTASVVMLFFILGRTTDTLWRSAFVAAVFAVHPLRAESVAWIAERKDVLATFFFMLTLAAYVGYVRQKTLPRYTMMAGSFLIGLLSKPSIVTLPFALLLLDYWPLRRKETPARLVVEKLPLLALAAVISVLTVLTLAIVQPGVQLPILTRLGNSLVYYVVYLRQMFWPVSLAVAYPYPPDGVPAWQMALAGIALLTISFLSWMERRQRPWLLVGWLWYLGVFVPMIGIKAAGAFAQADRYTYLPQIGIGIAVAWLAAEWKINRAAMIVMTALVLTALAACGWKQTSYWHDSERLWRRSLACTVDNSLALNNLGNALIDEGRLDEAIAREEQALKIRPDFAAAHYNLGLALSDKGQLDDGIAQFRDAIRINPDYFDAHYLLANALRKKGQVNEAILHYEVALKLRPEFAAAHNNLGTALHQAGRTSEAILQYEQALAQMPANESVHVNLAKALLEVGKPAQAIAQYEVALQMEPSDVEVQNNLAWQLATSSQASLRNGSEAVRLAQEAAKLTAGKNSIVLGTLAAALAETGQFTDATRAVQTAISLAQKMGQTALSRRLSDQLQLYQQGRPFHQP